MHTCDVETTLVSLTASGQMQSKHDPMGGEDGVEWLHPPDPGTYFLMVEFDYTRSEAEFIANIT